MANTEKPVLVLGARHAEVVQSAIRHWAESNIISEGQASMLADTIQVQVFDWQKFAKYSLRLAILLFFLAAVSLSLDKRLARIFKHVLTLPPWVRSVATSAAAVATHVFAHQRSQRLPQQMYTSEAIHGVGAVLFVLAYFQVIEQVDKSLLAERRAATEACDSAFKDNDKTYWQAAHERWNRDIVKITNVQRQAHFYVTWGLVTVYGAVGVLFASNFIWSCSMFILGHCFSDMGEYWLYGRRYIYIAYARSPLPLAGIGLGLIGAACLMRTHPLTVPLWSTTRTWGMLYVFVPLWLMTFVGYHDIIRGKRRALKRKMLVVLPPLILLVAAGISVWHGLRFGDSTTKGFGLTFIGINLYTKFVQRFWNRYKSLTFTVLAATCALIGMYAEDIWNLRLPSV